MTEIDPQEFGELRADVKHLLVGLREVQGKVDNMEQKLSEVRGGGKVLMFLGGGSGVLGAGLGAWVSQFFQRGGP